METVKTDNNGNKAAYPMVYDGDAGPAFCHDGMTKREYFAGLAMQGILANPSRAVLGNNVAKDALTYADELLKQLDS